MSTKHTELIERLLERTRDHAVRWEASGFDNEFVVNLSRSSIAIREETDRSDDGTHYALVVYDDAGKPIDQVLDVDLDPPQRKRNPHMVDLYQEPPEPRVWRRMMRQLFIEARRACYGADGVLDAALAELKAGR